MDSPSSSYSEQYDVRIPNKIPNNMNRKVIMRVKML